MYDTPAELTGMTAEAALLHSAGLRMESQHELQEEQPPR